MNIICFNLCMYKLMVSCHTSHPDSDKGRLALNVSKPPSSNMNGKEADESCVIE